MNRSRLSPPGVARHPAREGISGCVHPPLKRAPGLSAVASAKAERRSVQEEVFQ